MVNVGKSNGFFPGNLMELVNRNVNGAKPVIGRIDLMPGYTLFDVRKEDAHRVLDALKHADFFGDKIHAEIATEKDYASEGRGSRRSSGRGERKSSDRSRSRKDKSFADKKEKRSKAKSEKRDAKPQKEKKSKKEKGVKKSKPNYNGNYEIFYK